MRDVSRRENKIDGSEQNKIPTGPRQEDTVNGGGRFIHHDGGGGCGGSPFHSGAVLKLDPAHARIR